MNKKETKNKEVLIRKKERREKAKVAPGCSSINFL